MDVSSVGTFINEMCLFLGLHSNNHTCPWKNRIFKKSNCWKYDLSTPRALNYIFFPSELLHSSNLGHLLGLKPMNSFDYFLTCWYIFYPPEFKVSVFSFHPFHCLIEALLYSSYGQWKVLGIPSLGKFQLPKQLSPLWSWVVAEQLSISLAIGHAESYRSVHTGRVPAHPLLFVLRVQPLITSRLIKTVIIRGGSTLGKQ